jgi:integrase
MLSISDMEVEFYSVYDHRADERFCLAVIEVDGRCTTVSKAKTLEANSLLQAAKRYDARLLKKNADPLTASFHDIYFTFLHTGLRYNELVHLEWRDVDLRAGVLLVREKQIVEDRCCRMLNGEADIWGDLMDGKEDEDKVFSRAAQAEKLLARVRIRKIDDLLSLEVGDIDLEAETIHLRKSYVWSPKGSNGRVPISPKLVKLLAGRKKLSESRSQFVFPAPDGGKCRLHLLDVLQRLARKLKLPEPLPRVHDLRHSFASTLRRNGVPLESIMGLMRHSSIRETLRYAPYHEEEGRAAITTLDKLF